MLGPRCQCSLCNAGSQNIEEFHRHMKHFQIESNTDVILQNNKNNFSRFARIIPLPLSAGYCTNPQQERCENICETIITAECRKHCNGRLHGKITRGNNFNEYTNSQHLIHTGERSYLHKLFGNGHEPNINSLHKKSFICVACKKNFPSIARLKSHVRTHTGEKPYMCEVCEKRFTQSGSLTQHMRIHTGEKPYVCSTCNKGFTFNSGLRSHIRMHTGEKPYICKICGVSFTQSGSLKQHTRRHTGEKPRVHNACNKSLKINVTRHECEVCNRKFPQAGDLKRHFRTHTGEKPYKCNVCDKGFTQNGNLKKHAEMHKTKNG